MTANDNVCTDIKDDKAKVAKSEMNERDNIIFDDADKISIILDTWSCFRLCSRWRSGRGGAQCGWDNPPSEVGHYRQIPKQPPSETQIRCLRLWVFLNCINYGVWKVVREEKNIKKCIPFECFIPLCLDNSYKIRWDSLTDCQAQGKRQTRTLW